MEIDSSPSPSSMRTSINRLPPELKAQIVQELYFLLTEQRSEPSHPWLEHMVETFGEDSLATAVSPLVMMATGIQPFTDDVKLEERIAQDIKDRREREEELMLKRKGKGKGKAAAAVDEDGWEDEDEELSPLRPDERRPGMAEMVKTNRILEEIHHGHFASLRNLALVNREFAELSYPWIWREIDLEERSIQSIIFLIEEILPRHGQLVKSLAFGQTDLIDSTTRDGVQGLIDQVERMCEIVEEQPVGFTIRKRRMRSLAIAKLIKMCPNIEQLDCEAFQKHPIPDDAYEDDETIIQDPEVYVTDHALEAVKTYLGPKLIDLSLLLNDDGISSEGDVASLLEACPNLMRVDLEVYCGFKEPAERERLHKALLKLNKLDTLDVGSGYFINDEFVKLILEHQAKEEEAPHAIVSANPFPSMRCLALVECMDLSFESFFNLIHRFSSTLEVLDIDSTPHANHPGATKKFLGRPFDLPKLQSLVISTPHEPKILDSFVNCKLIEFSLGFCPAFKYKDVEDFITLHQDSLKKLEIADDAAMTEAQVESLEVFCHAKGIAVELLEPDSEDEEDEDEDMNPSDFDEDDEGGWYDADSAEEEYDDGEFDGYDDDEVDEAGGHLY